jgi:hypothetical protein
MPQRTSTCSDPAELYIYNPRAEQVSAEFDAPPAQTIGDCISCFQFDSFLSEHVDVQARVNHSLAGLYSDFVP